MPLGAVPSVKQTKKRWRFYGRQHSGYVSVRNQHPAGAAGRDPADRGAGGYVLRGQRQRDFPYHAYH